MKIVRIEATPVHLPLGKPMLMGGRVYAGVEAVVVRLVTSGRHAGWGEASIAPFLTGETLDGALAAIGRIEAALRGQGAADAGAAAAAVQAAVAGNPSSKAAVEVALMDALARERGIPLHRMLAPDAPPAFACLSLIGNSSRERDLAEAREKAREGFRGFKLKVGNGNTDEEAQTLTDLRAQLGDDALVCADANAAWPAAEAVRFVRLAENARPQFVEQPVAKDDLEGLAQVARASTIPVGLDEGLHSAEELVALLQRGIAKGGSFKILKFGGLAGCLQAARLCLSHGGRVNLSGKLGESSLANAATLALAAAIRPLSWGLSLTQHYLAQDIVKQPLASAGGKAVLPAGPGLGVEIDERKLAAVEISRPGERR